MLFQLIFHAPDTLVFHSFFIRFLSPQTLAIRFLWFARIENIGIVSHLLLVYLVQLACYLSCWLVNTVVGVRWMGWWSGLGGWGALLITLIGSHTILWAPHNQTLLARVTHLVSFIPRSMPRLQRIVFWLLIKIGARQATRRGGIRYPITFI